jgi:two-component system, NarL family, nitrate/nitrite response regulator NarL
VREDDVVTASTPGKTRIAVLATVRLYREGLARLLDERDEFTVCLAVAPRQVTLEMLAWARPQLIVLEVGDHLRPDFVRSVVNASPGSDTIAFAVRESREDILRCVTCGVAGFVPANGDIDDLVRALTCALDGEVACSPTSAAIMYREMQRVMTSSEDPGPVRALTFRQREIYDLLCEGRANKEIAKALMISVSTVKAHVHEVLQTMNAHSRAELAARRGATRSQLTSSAGC